MIWTHNGIFHLHTEIFKVLEKTLRISDAANGPHAGTRSRLPGTASNEMLASSVHDFFNRKLHVWIFAITPQD